MLPQIESMRPKSRLSTVSLFRGTEPPESPLAAAKTLTSSARVWPSRVGSAALRGLSDPCLCSFLLATGVVVAVPWESDRERSAWTSGEAGVLAAAGLLLLLLLLLAEVLGSTDGGELYALKDTAGVDTSCACACGSEKNANLLGEGEEGEGSTGRGTPSLASDSLSLSGVLGSSMIELDREGSGLTIELDRVEEGVSALECRCSWAIWS
jgi:hypothetical protein